MDFHDLKSEKQIAAKRAGLEGFLQLLIGGGHRAHVDADRGMATDAFERMPFQHAEEFRLGARAHLADLVEKDGAVVGGLKLADLLLRGAGECALLVAKQLALQ